MTKKLTVYMDATDWRHEIGEAMGGNTVYGSVEDCLKHNPCADSCGIVSCNIEFNAWEIPEDWGKAKYVTYTEEELKKNPDLQKMESCISRKKYLENLIEEMNIKIKFLEDKIAKNKIT